MLEDDSTVNDYRSFLLYRNGVKMHLTIMSKSSRLSLLRIPHIHHLLLFLLHMLLSHQLRAAGSPSSYALDALIPLPSPAYGEGCSPDRRTFGT